MNLKKLKNDLLDGKLDEVLLPLYGSDQLFAQHERYLGALEAFADLYGEDHNVGIYSAPGRTEIAGNHTDHNNGKVLAASVNLDVIAVVAKIDEPKIYLQSQGHSPDEVSLKSLEIHASERNLSSSLIRGIAAKFVKEKYKIGGFCAYTTSNVLKGSGLSSSAAFEVLVGTILNHLYNKGTVPAIAIAQYAQFAENVYFGKPSGLMDQMASSVGGMISIDFANVKKPLIKQVKFDFDALNCALCIVDTGGSHADLTDEYASIPDEMKNIAAMFTKPTLQGLTMDDLLQNIQPIRRKLGDRALLRAFHFLKENDRVDAIIAALGRSDYAAFKKIVIESGNSSFRFLQNVYANAVPREQGLALALFLAEDLLDGKGAYRVHGGGFGGTTQNYVPLALVDSFRSRMEAVFGEGCCHSLSIRPVGGTEIIGSINP